MSFRNYYDTSTYGRSRDTGRNASSASTDRPTTVTAKYINTTPSYKSSSIPILCSDKTKDETPISTIASRYASYNKNDKPISKYEKKDYSKLTIPSVNTKNRDVSPISTSSKYSYSRPSRHLSPERRTPKSFKEKSRDSSPVDRDKDIPSKTDKSTSYSSLSSYKLYPRSSSYTRPASRTETKPEVTVNRYAIASRLSSNYLRSPPTVKRTSVSPVNHIDIAKNDIDKPVTPTIVVQENSKLQIKSVPEKIESKSEYNNGKEDENVNETETVTVVTRHTSPTPPGSSAYVRIRRADMAKTIEKTLSRPKKRPNMIDKEVQSDRLDDPTRSSRFGSTSRASTTNWSYYTPGVNNYTGYAGRYSTQYSTIRENSNSNVQSDRSSRSRSKEPQPKENTSSISSSSCTESKNKTIDNCNLNNVTDTANHDIVTVYEQNKDDETSEIIINVNLKLKRAKSPLAAATELVSPEVTITNSLLPPQAPKTDGTTKIKKTKVRKSSTDSSSDSTPKKKTVKKRSKSVSSTDSDQGSEISDKTKESTPPSSSKNVPKKSTSSNLINGRQKLKHSKSRESNSPESSITLSTQSSVSEDDTISKSKTQDVSRTSADEISIPTDRSGGRQSSPNISQKNDGGTEEAKSFLIRALAPVTNLFKMKHQDSSENSRWPENSTSDSTGKDVSNLLTESDRSSKSKNIIASSDDKLVQLKAIRHIESGEKAWWLDSDSDKKNKINSNETPNTSSEKNQSRKIKRIESGEKAWWLESNSDNKNENSIVNSNSVEKIDGNKQTKKYKNENDEKPWWLDSSANIPEGIERLTPPRKSSSDSDKSEKFNFYKVRHIESGEQKDWWLTSNESSLQNNKPEAQISLSKSGSDQKSFPIRRIRHVESGERPWWLSSSKNIPEGVEKLPTPPPQEESDSSESEEVEVYATQNHIPPFPLNLPDDEPLGDRRSPEGLETPRENEDYRGRTSPYENNRQYRRNLSYQKSMDRYISRYTDIDDILGTSGQIYSPFMDSILARRTGQISYDDDECEEIDPTQVRIHDSTAQRPVIKKLRCRSEIVDYRTEDQLDDATLQVFKDGDYGPYLDLDSTLGEQDEELEGLQENRKNALVLRTQLPVRVHAIIERLLRTQGRELRRALFSLKQILQSDKDLVHDFVANKGLDCLMQIGNMEDQNYIDYILRALGQILLYVDGMHGVMGHKHCVQWLYSLISSKFRHVVKTALKLLVVFVEYTENNSLLLIDAITSVDGSNGRPTWYNLMKILQDFDASDTELLIYATTLINICLNNVPDRDTYYDQVDALQDQGIDDIIQLYMSKQGTDLDLLRQLQIFEAVLLYEDGDESGTALKQLDESVVTSVRRRSINLNTSERRKSKKQQMKDKANSLDTNHAEPENKNSNNHRPQFLPTIIDNKDNKELSTALRRRRDRFARQAQQQELLNNSNGLYNGLFGNTNSYQNGNGNYNNNGNYTNGNYTNTNNNYKNANGNGNSHYASNGVNGVNGHQEEEDAYVSRTVKNLNLADVLKNGNQRYTAGLKQRIQNGTLGHSVNAVDALAVMRQKQLDNTPEAKDDRGILLNREHSIKDLAQRLTSPVSPTAEDKPLRVAEMTGIVSKAKEELAKSQSKEVIKSPSIEKSPKVHEIKVSENDLHWEELKKGCMNRAFHLCDLDFSDLRHDSDDDMGSPAVNISNGPPPPPPNMFLPPVGVPPPLPFTMLSKNIPVPPPKPNLSSELSNDSDSSTIKKSKKTVKLFWREIQENPAPVPLRPKLGGFIWDDLPEINLDTAILEHLFESRTNDLILKEKLMEPKRNLILDAKRSNAINIAMKKLPTPQTIKAAIMKMDATVIGREGIEKLLTMLPTEEEKIKIQEAQYANPDLPLGSAEQFLLTLASINELSSRLKLWVFKLDFDNLEKEIAEPLMDLKHGIELLKANRTFKVILSTLRSVGSFLNGSQVKGFRLEYLSKVMEVKDTVHKHPLLYHICEMIIEKFQDTTDFFSEVGAVIRVSKVDFDILHTNLLKLEADCKASWDHMKRIAKHDGSQIFKTKINEFLTDAAERIILLSVIKKRVMNRYGKFLLYLGVPAHDIPKTKPSEFLKIIAEFALEYRTTRERVLQQLEKRANHRERNKTRGKMIIDVGNYSNKNGDHSADNALKELLKTDPDTDSLTESRRKASNNKRMMVNGDMSADDEIIESLVRSATTKRKPITRQRRRNRLSDKKLFNRTLDGHQSWPGQECNSGATADIQQR
ncbi:uncharacterized protein LOC131849156 [Achroia grisella]|uniref:uncharacterized protein LOC131849156 n=1 Tax=Achroia grisella TaxID=688607 RepID=UPI0027D24042|nr:uncharacterized protein LOC131849156 [Achroia grisella]